MRSVYILALPVLMLGAGCFPSALGLNDPKPPPPAPVIQGPKLPVTPESVTATNAHQKADALDDELKPDER
jgi:hypothetical protein